MPDRDRWTEDDLRYSTDAVDYGLRPDGARYTSARDALEQWFRLRQSGPAGIDYAEAVAVDTSRTPDDPAGRRTHELFFLERVFATARERVRDYLWRCWGLVRVEQASVSTAARREELERRGEIKQLHDREALVEWCHHYEIPVPPGEGEGRQAWASNVGVRLEHIRDQTDGVADIWDLALAAAGPSGRAVRRYRDQVDGVIENVLDELPEESALVKFAVRDGDEVHALLDGSSQPAAQ